MNQGQRPAVVQVRVGQEHRVQPTQRRRTGQVRQLVSLGFAHADPGVDQDPLPPGLDQKRARSNFVCSTQEIHSHGKGSITGGPGNGQGGSGQAGKKVQELCDSTTSNGWTRGNRSHDPADLGGAVNGQEILTALVQ